MNLTRPVAFWIAVLAALVVAVGLLREVLLPFVAGMLLAHLLDPLATRLERLGMNRLVATLTIVGLFVAGVTALIILTAPVVVRELAYFIDNFPLYIKRARELATDPNRPWLSKLVGEGLAYAEQIFPGRHPLGREGQSCSVKSRSRCWRLQHLECLHPTSRRRVVAAGAAVSMAAADRQ